MKSRRAVSRSENGEQSPLGLDGEDEVRVLLRTAWTFPPWPTERVATIHQDHLEHQEHLEHSENLEP